MNTQDLLSKASKLLGAVTIFGAISAAAFSEGVDYVKLDKPIPNADKTLIKVFSYDCPFCYKYDKSVTPAVVSKLEGMADFRLFHLHTKGKYGKLGSELFAVLIVKDQTNGVKNSFDEKSLFKKAKIAYYKAYHDKKERWSDGKDPEYFLKLGLEASGLSKAEFEEALEDEKVQNLIKEWENSTYDVAKIQGVPAFVVNGKYLIYTKSISSIDGMVELVKELLAK